LIVIVGPTAVGKSALALELAESLGGEIVSADSRQVYRYMDIGTGKPSREDRARVPHHLIDVVDPDQDFSLALYQRLAYQAIDEIFSRGHLPFLVGGSGLYITAITSGLRIPEIAPDPELRRELEALARSRGAEWLHRQLREVDPQAASRVDPRNVRRVVRALEVYRATGVPFSLWQRREPPPYAALMLGLTMERRDLYRRIDERVDRMIALGLVDEVRGLAARGYGFDLPAMSGLGYGEIGRYLQGKAGLGEAVQMIKHHTHRFVRHQYNWFRLSDPNIRWLQVQSGLEKLARSLVAEHLERCCAGDSFLAGRPRT